jgi:DNA replication initiation complex subunit (GINS family)
VNPETGVSAITGVIRFYSLADVRRYMKELLDEYQREYDKSSNIIGSLLRSDGGKSMEVIMSKGWTKVGSLILNMADSEKGAMEVVFQIVNEMKPRIAKTEQVLRSFDSIEALPIPENATFLLYLRDGVPERLIVDTVETKPQKFLFNGKFKTE